MNSLQDCEWSRRCSSRQAINVSRISHFPCANFTNSATRTDFRSEGKPFGSRKNFVIKLFARDGRYYFSATHKNFTRLLFRGTRISNEISLSLFSFLSFFLAHTHIPIYIDRGTLIVARLTLHDFQTTKLSAFGECLQVRRKNIRTVSSKLRLLLAQNE